VRALETHLLALDGTDAVLAGPAGEEATERLLATGRFAELVDVLVDPGARPRTSLSAARRLLAWVRTHPGRVRAIHANGMPEMAVAWPAARRAGVPLVVWAHGVDVPRYVRAAAVLWRTRLVEIRWAAVSEAAAADILSTSVTTADRMTVVPNPIDPSIVEAAPIGRDPDVVNVGFLGGASPRKGFDLLPGLLASLDDLPVRLLIAGSSPETGAPGWGDLLVHEERVTVMGLLQDVRDLYGRADIVVMPSRQESFGRVAAEAMVNGLPVVASDLPAVREVVEDGVSGLLIPIGDQAAFNGAVRTLAEDRELAAAFGRRGRELAQRYLPASVSAKLAALYD
jgi:glycosyltransferase involved in cell wall biosynthesis